MWESGLLDQADTKGLFSHCLSNFPLAVRSEAVYTYAYSARPRPPQAFAHTDYFPWQDPPGLVAKEIPVTLIALCQKTYPIGLKVHCALAQ